MSASRRSRWALGWLHGGFALCWAMAVADDVPWLADVQRPPAAPIAEAVSLAPLLPGAEPAADVERAAWERRREELRRDWLQFLGPLSRKRLARGPAPPAVTVIAGETVDGVERRLIRYEVEPGEPVDAYLLRPADLAGPAPGVVVFHSTAPESLRQPAGLEGAPEKAFGLQLAQRGCVVICPRNYLWPPEGPLDAKGRAAAFLSRQPSSLGMDRMLADGLAAVDLLAADPDVDAHRLGCIGHSLGAKEALYLAAFDERMQAAVSSEGGIGTTFSNWHDPWYLGEAVRRPGLAREHHELLALVAPRPFLLVGGDSADGDRSWPFIAAALPIYRAYGESAPLGLLNHQQGHSVPPDAGARMLEWLLAYLGTAPQS